MATMSTSLRNGYDGTMGYEFPNHIGLAHSDSDPGPSQPSASGLDLGYHPNNYAGPSQQDGMQMPARHAPHHGQPPHLAHQLHAHPAPMSNGFDHLNAGGSIPPMSHPYINTHPSNPNPYTSYQPSPVPGPAYAAQHMPQHYMSGMPPGPAHAMPPPGYSFGQPPSRELWPNHGDWDDERDYVDGQEVIYGQLEVKHRRRTTPEQLKVLEHWFDVNPKPDNNLREWLAVELGMTKRNIQVWFQNRAKVKGLAQKEKAAAAKAATDVGKGDQARTPENASTTSPDNGPPVLTESKPTPSPEEVNQHRSAPPRPAPLQLYSQSQVAQLSSQSALLPPVNGVNMGRRASLANGEAARIESFIAKQRMAARKAGGGVVRQPGLVSPVGSPVIGQYQASAARRSSIPYPTPNLDGGSSPKISPSVRPAPSALHLAAMRNNVRRASMPGVAGQVQLISSGPFTPPRVASIGTGHNGQGIRELSPIKDHDGEHPSLANSEHFYFPDASDMSATFLTPPSSTYMPSHSPSTFLGSDSSAGTFDFGTDAMPFTPNGPLPQPGFSFGSAAPVPPPMSVEEQNNMWMAMQGRGRLGSIASINTFTTDGATAADGSEWEWPVTAGLVEPEGFDPDLRRASAPADLLHNLNLSYLAGQPLVNMHNTPLRPSPLGAPIAAGAAPYGMGSSFSNTTTGSGDGYLYPSGANFSTSNSDTSPITDSSKSSPTGLVGQAGKGSAQHGQNGHKPGHLSLSMSPMHPNYDGAQTGQGSHETSPYSALSGGFTLPPGVMGYGDSGSAFGMEGHHLTGDERAKTEDYSFFEGMPADTINVLA